ncbi:hypothetical protein DSO57_1030609 [Entomophthora muscae]|uniref:Uncharacterized protein n=1 Tax=Entomophthora muscae TaxID=34485 RepID=A0ACC2TC36_9FUNG|nr:hypothetical protein DSO57_1030609 [Entomophthora muscae]
MRQFIPMYVRERLHEFHQLEQPWQTQVDSTLNAYLSNFERLVQQLNTFSVYSFEQLQQVADLAAKGLNELSVEFDQERATTAAAIAKLQSQVNELSTPKPVVPPSPPVREPTLTGQLASVWELAGCGLGEQGPPKDWC